MPRSTASSSPPPPITYEPLIKQLKGGAALVIPVGPVGAVQTMWRFTVDDDGHVTGKNLGSVMFVPFTRAEE